MDLVRMFEGVAMDLENHAKILQSTAIEDRATAVLAMTLSKMAKSLAKRIAQEKEGVDDE